MTANQKVLTMRKELKPKSTACFMEILPLTTSKESQRRKRFILSCIMSSSSLQTTEEIRFLTEPALS